MSKRVLGIVGGTGLYQVEGLINTRWEKISTPWGDPSDELLIGELKDVTLVFLPRHGRIHQYSPSTINYQANIHALKRVGVTDIISISSCGSLQEKHEPGQFVIVDQFIDRTVKREKSFFTDDVVAHVSFSDPVCQWLGDCVERAAKSAQIPHHRGGTYLAMEGPQFSTKAESSLYRAWGCDVIGMTNMPEAKLAREAEICYQSVAMVTDFDSWHPEHGSVSIDVIIQNLNKNVTNAQKLLIQLVDQFSQRPIPCPQGCDKALDGAILSHNLSHNSHTVKKLSVIAERVLKQKVEEGVYCED